MRTKYASCDGLAPGDWGYDIAVGFIDGGGFLRRENVEEANARFTRLLERTRNSGSIDEWKKRLAPLALWCAICLELDIAPRALIEIIYLVGRRHDHWFGQLSFSLLVFASSFTDANDKTARVQQSIPPSGISIEALEQVRADLFHVIWQVWISTGDSVIRGGRLDVTNHDLSNLTEHADAECKLKWAPRILCFLADLGTAEANYLLGILGDDTVDRMLKADSDRFVPASLYLGYAWRDDDEEEALVYFERACGLDILFDDQDPNQHVFEYINELSTVESLLNSNEISNAGDKYPYMDLLWHIVEDASEQAKQIESKKKSSRPKKQKYNDAFVYSEKEIDAKVKESLKGSSVHLNWENEHDLLGQYYAAARCALRFAMSKDAVWNRETISAMFMELGKLLEAFFKWSLVRFPPKKIVSFYQNHLGELLKEGGCFSDTKTPQQLVFRGALNEKQISDIAKLLSVAQKHPRKIWAERAQIRVLIGANLLSAYSDMQHPWRVEKAACAMKMLRVIRWYEHRNNSAHFRTDFGNFAVSRTEESSEIFLECFDWVERWVACLGKY